MGMRWNTFGFLLRIYVSLISVWGIRECWSLNDEGLALLEFRARITSDPYDALANWNPNDCDPCKWLGVHCVDGKVQILDLSGLSLEGTLAPELGKLSHLKSLVLSKNNFSGAIPKELGDLANLELLDLRENNLSGSIPAEIGRLLLLKHLLLCDNKIEGGNSQDQGKFRFPYKSLLVDNCSSTLTTLVACINRKFGHCVWQSNFKQWNNTSTLIKTALMKYLNAFALPLFNLGTHAPHDLEENCCDLLPSSNEPEIAQNAPNLVNSARRKLLDQSSNLAAAPYSGPTIEFSSVPTTLSSGAFPAVPDANKKQNQSPPPPPSPSHASDGNQASQQHSANSDSGKLWRYIIIIAVVTVLVIVIIVLLCIWRKRAAKVISPWRTGISGQLQKAFITGVPKLNRSELETACEDFSNIISSYELCTLYKGTLSSGVEIAVVSTLVTSSQDWSKKMEMNYRKKIDTLSRINHKNFINLIGYCEEEEPFTRMLVFEYAPNGNLFEYLHVKEIERLDWSERVRIIMGIAYCLQYMHHDLNTPVAHSNFSSSMIFLTDDFAAKIAEITFGNVSRAKKTGGDSKKSELPPHANLETNVYDFGILLLEIISGKLPYSEEQGNLVNWAADYLNDKRKISYMIDPTLQSFKDNELDVICEVIQDCIQPDPRLRPTMRDITSKLREVLGVSPEQAVPRLSPLWWAELEILSVEAT
ncbi:protein MALE DISCOVERER 2-like [Gastrolobium bilobum]|uniref:protein MALE DISCOVERER 2-like n=1 Tax=Gastrolobium bilobum TaxID=150636 RepID=UPI002AB1BE27|nr:protein MALE DISCOVERER 2-like [Gastrolobium bilobum]